MEIERKYGATAQVVFPLVGRGIQDFTLSASTAAGDIMVVKDEATAVTAANLATLVSGSNGLYQLTLSDTEMQASRIAVSIVDATATKIWEDQAVLISTYGNASAQHALDRGTAAPSVNVIQWLGVAPNALSTGTVQVDVRRCNADTVSVSNLNNWLGEGLTSTADSGTTTTIVDAALTQNDDHWNGAILVFLDGTNAGFGRTVTDFDAATDTLTFSPPLGSAVTTEQYVLIPGVGLAAADLANTTDGLGAIKTDTAAILLDTGTDGVVVGTNNDKTGYSVDSITTAGVTDIMTRDAMVESYAADGATFTPAQAFYEINQRLSDFSASATAISVHKRDGTTEAYKLSLNSTASPTSVTRVS